MDSEQLLQFCVEKAQEKKAAQLLSLKLRDLTLICDYFLLMTAANSRQAQAIADSLTEELKAAGEAPLHTEGYRDGRWILLDCGNLVIHIFQEEERRYYNLERLWGDADAVQYD